jgi:transcription antitermination factor NusG
MTWHAFIASPAREFTVRELLIRSGIDCLVPGHIVKRRSASRRWRHVLIPRLPRYVFARCGDPADYYAVKRTKHVVGVVGFDGTPAVLRERDIRLLHDWSHVEPMDRERSSKFRVGSMVQFEDVRHPFHGWVVPIVGLDGAHARVLLKLFGADRHITVDIADLAAA